MFLPLNQKQGALTDAQLPANCLPSVLLSLSPSPLLLLVSPPAYKAGKKKGGSERKVDPLCMGHQGRDAIGWWEDKYEI